jgi:hypothetical protein
MYNFDIHQSYTVIYSPHPYMFFNRTGGTFTVMGFCIEKDTLNLIDTTSGMPLECNIIPRNLYDALIRNRVSLDENFDELPR